MTDPERVEALAEVLAEATDCPECEGTGRSRQGWSANYGDQFGPCQVCTRVAQALAPLLAKWRAADRAEALREAADALTIPGRPHGPYSRTLLARAAALAAEPDAGGDRG